MITIIYSTHKNYDYNNKFKEHLLKSSGLKGIQILEYQNNNEYSLSEIYNKGISESIFDIVVCCHNDIKLESNWGKKLIKDFQENPEYGIIGKAGTTNFPESGIYWEKINQCMVGQVYHHPEGQSKYLSKYSPKLPIIVPVVSIDGLFMSFDKTKIKHKFDESIGRFHYYDHLFCIPNYLDGVKIGVTSSFEITHQSIGQPNQEFFDTRIKFLEKWVSKLPINLYPEKPFIEEIKEKPIKNFKKIAVIIPTKGKVDMLYECVKSFYDHCNPSLFDIFIADTGSSESEKEWMRNNIVNLGNIKLIEYDYYNFGKINNDVVKNHVNDDYEFLLFCNNDIKILNNVIYDMLQVFKEKSSVGTVGPRLHFENNTIQHNGIVMYFSKKQNHLGVTHISLGSYYNYNKNLNEVIGNTGAFLMIRKSLFLKCGMFNEQYTDCFEDVELNLKCVLLGLKNYNSGKSVAYHYESQTRDEDNEKLKKLNEDYNKVLFPFMLENFNRLKDKVVYVD